MKEFKCGDVVPNCTFQAHGNNEDEIIGQAVQHAREDHGMEVVPDELVSQVREAIRDV